MLAEPATGVTGGEGWRRGGHAKKGVGGGQNSFKGDWEMRDLGDLGDVKDGEGALNMSRH